MKKLKESTKIIIGMVIGLILSTVSYVVAENLINSKDVVYEDNSNLVADNVQEAIDGTCTKIDTRLSDIEDKLYTVKKISKEQSITTTTTYSYTGVSITFPAKSYCTITIGNGWSDRKPRGIILSNGKDTILNTRAVVVLNEDAIIYTTYSSYFDNETTYYVWAKHASAGLNDVIGYNGWCATKYKQNT